MAGRALWGFEDRGRIADVAAGAEGGRCCRRERTTTGLFGGRRMRAAGMGSGGWRACADVVRTSRSLLRRVAGGEARRRCEAGCAAIGHEVSILIRLGDGDRAGARAVECFDDDHPAAATWAAAHRRSCFGLAVRLGVRALGCSPRARRAPGGRARCCALEPRRRRGRSGGCGGSRSAGRAGESGGCSVRVSPGKEDEHVI